MSVTIGGIKILTKKLNQLTGQAKIDFCKIVNIDYDDVSKLYTYYLKGDAATDNSVRIIFDNETLLFQIKNETWENINISDIKLDNESLIERLNQLWSTLNQHEDNQNNPHNVTKSQVGLSNVDNTSDINKPISSATQTALNLKEDKANKGMANGYP